MSDSDRGGARRDSTIAGTGRCRQPVGVLPARSSRTIVSITHATDQVLRGGAGPSAVELADRAAERDRIEAVPPPRMLGAVEAPPPLDALPKMMARATATMANLAADATPAATLDDPSRVSGVGVGRTAYRGRACVVHDLMVAFDRLEPGDVLVAPVTGPSMNSLLPVVGALVVEVWVRGTRQR